jgi:excisionase family DNA binding protein
MSADAGLTVAEVARRYRVSRDKVRTWIRQGELIAINTASALCGKPRWVISAEALATFERRRASGPPPTRPARRLKLATDYYPDETPN